MLKCFWLLLLNHAYQLSMIGVDDQLLEFGLFVCLIFLVCFVIYLYKNLLANLGWLP